MNEQDEILLVADVTKLTKLSSTGIWRGINENSFPKPDMIIGKTRRAWLKSTIMQYLNDLIAKQKSSDPMKGLDHATM